MDRVQEINKIANKSYKWSDKEVHTHTCWLGMR